jgi:DNA topoisomerase-1
MPAMIIVESKAKVSSIGKIVGDQYSLHYCLGHIYDLPEKELGIDIKKDFKPRYVQVRGKGKLISSLKKSGESFDKIILATDPDREGESIAWHLSRLFDKKEIRRMRFNEITEKAIKEALNSTTEIDMRLVNAQQARRVLDRLVGYKISPLLWKFLKGGLSAGRVQSVAVRLICDREKEIEAFVPDESWSLTGDFTREQGPGLIQAQFHGKREGEIKVENEEQAKTFEAELRGLSYIVDTVATRREKRRPPAPFITSSLQQDSARRLNFSASKTMTIAQQLYEGVEIGNEGVVGLITYMRTDSTRVSSYAQEQAVEYITEKLGADYVPSKPNVFKTKASAKASVQDAHEAVRPTSVYYEPKMMKEKLSRDQYRLYELIWNRFLASQIRSALVDVTRIDIAGGDYIFRASGSVLIFDGWQRVIKTMKDAVENDADTENKGEQKLPQVTEGEPVNMEDLILKQHFTKPPPRFSEASLVRVLEEKGIGRPSTFVPTIETLKKRGYVTVEKRSFTPTKWGFIVTELLSKNFKDIVDDEFTARMEDNLDKVEEGEIEWQKVVGDFYETFVKELDKAEHNMKYEEETDVKCKECDSNMVIKAGRYGLFLGCSKYPDCTYTEPFDPISGRSKGATKKAEPVPTGEFCDKCGSEFLIREGRYGKFMACSGYPKCRNIKPYIGDFDCPKDGCDGKVVKKITKKRKTIYGCSKYPDCDYVSWYPPLEDEKCPNCGTFFTRASVKGKIMKKCAKESCGAMVEDLQEAKKDESEE